jgi:REP element-mobilizing transposase RayT
LGLRRFRASNVKRLEIWKETPQMLRKVIMPQSLSKLYVHLVFSTKDRLPLLDDDVRDNFHAYCSGVIRNLSCHPVQINSVKDHIHLLLDLSRTAFVSKVVEVLKSSSCVWIKKQNPSRAFAWQNGYGAFSTSESHVESVIEYIKNQFAHHRQKSFQDEYRELLIRHAIRFDERYVWD